MASKNTYTAAAQEITELFGEYLEGDASRPALVLSNAALAQTARVALEKSMESFGYAEPTCTFATLTSTSAESGKGAPIDAQALFILIEGLDPHFVICTDAAATQAAADAYRTQFSCDSSIRVFGRPGVAFADLATMLDTERGKQSAWRLLKALPG